MGPYLDDTEIRQVARCLLQALAIPFPAEEAAALPV
jgi:hypothetical protein